MATILVVDDEAPLATLLKMTLEQEAHTAIVAYSGPEAMRLARERRPDLALFDLMLPFMDGTQLCRALHREAVTAAMPIILMSAFEPVDWQSCGAVAFLTKPFAFAAVPGLITKHLYRSG